MKLLNLFTVVAALCAPVAASAQAYPAKPIRWIVPYSTGGVSDIAARYLAQRFATVLGGSIVVENRTGAGGVIGTEYVARSPADGYTWVWGATAALATNLAIHKSLPYDPLKDLVPVCPNCHAVIHLRTPPYTPKETRRMLRPKRTIN